MKQNASDIPSNTRAYRAMAVCASWPPLVRYSAMVAVAKGMTTTKRRSKRLRKSKVRSTTRMFVISAWWLTELLQQGTVAGSADRQVQRQQRDGHGKHAIAERLQPASIHRAFYLSRD